MDYAKESLRLHREWKGKIEVICRAPLENRDDLSLAYTPGVAQPCLEIQKDPDQSWELTPPFQSGSRSNGRNRCFGAWGYRSRGRYACYGGKMCSL